MAIWENAEEFDQTLDGLCCDDLDVELVLRDLSASSSNCALKVLLLLFYISQALKHLRFLRLPCLWCCNRDVTLRVRRCIHGLLAGIALHALVVG